MNFKQLYSRIIKLLKYKLIYKYVGSRIYKIEDIQQVQLNEVPFCSIKEFNYLSEATENNIDNIIREANEILKNQFSFLNKELKLKKDFDWNHLETDDVLWKYYLNYFDFGIILLKSYLYTRDQIYLNKLVNLINNWIDNTKPGDKITWDPYPISRRVVNWLTLLAYFRQIEDVDQEFISKLNTSIIQQTEFLINNLEYDLQNNHLTSNAKALIWAGVILNEYNQADKWYKKGIEIFKERMEEEILEDGFQHENSSSYQMITIKDYLETALLLKGNNINFSEEILFKLERMFEALQAIIRPDRKVPLLNDSIYGYPITAKELMAVGAVLFAREDFKWLAKEANLEYLFWLLGKEGYEKFKSLNEIKPCYFSKALKNAGYYVMRSGWDENDTYLIFDCGKFGPEHCPGHGHTDALSFELFANGQPLLVDPGVYNYSGEYRKKFKSTTNHNTITINNKNQSQLLDNFKISNMINPETDYYNFNKDIDKVKGNYRVYDKDITHSREIEFFKPNRVIITDIINGSDEKIVNVKFNLIFSELLQGITRSDKGVECKFHNLDVNFKFISNKSGKLQITNTLLSYQWNELLKTKKMTYLIQEQLPIKIRTIIKLEYRGD